MKPLLPIAILALALWAVADEAPQPPKPQLQIFNASDRPIDVQWLKSETVRSASSHLESGTSTLITTFIGHRFAIVDGDGLDAAIITSEVPVQAFRYDPEGKDGVPAIYTQRTDAHGFPIVASGKVNPYALKEAGYILDLMLAHRPDVRTAMIKSGARMCIIGSTEFTTELPEFARLANEPNPDFPNLSVRDYWDARARGTGGSRTDPFCSCAEENVLGYPGDPYEKECILIHEFAHSIHLRGMVNVDATFDRRLEAAYQAAMKAGLWKGKYPSVNHHEYFAEGVQSWFDDNRENDHDHNHVNTRAELIEYDPALAVLCREVFGDTSFKYTKPATRLTGHLAGYDPAKAPAFAFPERLVSAREQIRAWARQRERWATSRERRDISGWTVQVSKELLTKDQAATEKALQLLQEMLNEIVRVVPASAVTRLREVPLYFSPVYEGQRPRAEYHAEAAWLRKNGRDPAMARAVEFTNVSIFEQEKRRMPNFALHELAHAYHHRVLGYDNPDIKAAYEKALASGSYAKVERRDSEGRTRLDRAYAMTNRMEYFAECSEAFFVTNDFFPFNWKQLQQHDPVMFALLEKLWKPEQSIKR